MDELLSLAIAYQIAQEFDGVPSPDSYKEAVKFYGKFPKEVLEDHQGLHAYEVAGAIVRKILKEKTND